jgi:alkanesulfonate monooxygenase SsuD/methylene tetrahydromethanopterin reductase-like flavin-dependent oxidoreductase (luciferase family)
MQIGIGLPTTVPGVRGADLLRWARDAEDFGFSSLGVLDRLVYPSHEPIVALTAAAAVTQRIRLATTILIAAYRGNTALLAKQLADLHQISEGRLTVGVAAGGRADDFDASGMRYGDRGRTLDLMLGGMTRMWASERFLVPPSPYGRPRVLIGGHSRAAQRRAARYGDGWIMGGSSSVPYSELAARIQDLWAEEKRTGRPQLMAIAHVALGVGSRDPAERYIRDFYAHAGAHAGRVVAGLLDTDEALQRAAHSYASAGCGELILFPCVPDRGQLGLIAKALGPDREPWRNGHG